MAGPEYPLHALRTANIGCIQQNKHGGAALAVIAVLLVLLALYNAG